MTTITPFEILYKQFQNNFVDAKEQELDFLLERMRNVRTLNKASAKLLKELEAELETKFPDFNKVD